ncbi:MAG TPA: hypothetical protein EYP24_04965, partial [bacterium (Candidatus Stahlbacteria)]|nr:hypothetical protein [Candidatus Stahlbacteria bacterium]
FTARLFYYSLFSIDCLLTTAIILHTGGSESLFPLLYPIIILASAIYLFRGAFVISAIAFTLYSLLLYLELRGGLFPVQYLYSRTYLYGILLFLVAYLGSNLAIRIKRAEITTAEIIDSLPVKIAAVDDNGDFYYTNVTDEKIRDLISHFHRSRRGYEEVKVGEKVYSFSLHPLTARGLDLILAEDITDQKKLAERTRLYDKIKLLAQLGASLAHEIRNPLASIRGAVEIIARSRIGPKRKRLLSMAINEVDRASRTIEDFLEFSRMRPLKRCKVRLNAILGDLLTSEPMPENITLKIDLPDNFSIIADRYLIYRVIRNLIQNAKQAIGQKEGVIAIRGVKKDDYAEIMISDNGPGIPPRVLNHIFEPFYSTREDGTGLGLAIVETIINQHGGTISVKSEIGQGATFTITLPETWHTGS